jgi:hypothetical protein
VSLRAGAGEERTVTKNLIWLLMVLGMLPTLSVAQSFHPRPARVIITNSDPVGTGREGLFWVNSSTGDSFSWYGGAWNDFADPTPSTTFPLLGPTGCVLPAYAFTDDPDAGMCLSAANTLEIRNSNPTASRSRAFFGATQLFLSSHDAGSLGVTLTLNNATQSLLMSTSNTTRLTLGTTSFTSTIPFLGPSGCTTPMYSFTGDAASGLCLDSGEVKVGFRPNASTFSYALFGDSFLDLLVENNLGLTTSLSLGGAPTLSAILSSGNSFFLSGSDGQPNYGIASHGAPASNPEAFLEAVLSGGSTGRVSVRSTGAHLRIGTNSYAGEIGAVTGFNVTSTGNIGIGEDDLHSYTVAANTLSTNGDSLHLTAGGTFAATANNKQLRVKFGATNVFDSGSLVTAVATDWSVVCDVFRTGAATQKAICTFTSDNSMMLPQDVDYTTPAETLTGAVTFRLTGEATANDDIVNEVSKVLWEPTNS